jgi:hypothetical protein
MEGYKRTNQKEIKIIEKSLADKLKDEGYTVYGGH